MTQKTKVTLFGTVFALIGFALYIALMAGRVEAAGITGGEQYKVVRIGDYATRGMVTAKELESGLNDLSAQGWKVRSAVEGYIILSK